MTSTTDQFWDVDGTSLHSYAFNVSTLTGRLGVPPLKGSNVTVPFRVGDDFRPKLPGARTLTLAMWVQGCGYEGDPAAVVGYPIDTLFNRNYDDLVRLLYHPRQELNLTKRWAMPSGLMQATARAQYAGGLDAQMDTVGHAQVSVDLLLADPFFYADLVSSPHIHRGDSAVLRNPGSFHAFSTGIVVHLVGPLTAPVVLRATHPAHKDVALTYGRDLDAGRTVDLDVANFMATRDDGANMIQSVSRVGSRSWMVAWRGDTTYALTAPGGSGYAVVSFQPPYV